MCSRREDLSPPCWHSAPAWAAQGHVSVAEVGPQLLPQEALKFQGKHSTPAGVKDNKCEMMTTSRLFTHTAWPCLHKFGTGWGAVDPV